MELIAACELNGGIGYNNDIPWETIKEDLKHFYKITTTSPPHLTNAIVMGSKTWESLPYKPLKKRLNLILSRKGLSIKEYQPEHVKVFNSREALTKFLLEYNQKINKVFIIGGQEIYNLFYTAITKVHLTMIKQFYKCDRFLDIKYINENFDIVEKINKQDISIITMTRKNELKNLDYY